MQASQADNDHIPLTPVRRQVHGRRHGPRLSPRKQQLCDNLLPSLRITSLNPSQNCDPHSLFEEKVEVIWLEIGFGGGEHLAWQASQNPSIGIIGCEPFINGVAKLLTQIDDEKLSNIRLHDDDATMLLDALAPASIDRLFLLHPDPWPKKRHWKRRFINDENLDRLARVLKPGGEFRFASDIPHYIAWTLKYMVKRNDFEWLARSPSDWRQRPADWPATRYGEKALREGRPPMHLRFQRLPD